MGFYTAGQDTKNTASSPEIGLTSEEIQEAIDKYTAKEQEEREAA